MRKDSWICGQDLNAILLGSCTQLQMTSLTSLAELQEVQALPKGNSKYSPKSFETTEVSEATESSDPLARITVSLPRSLCRQFRLHALDQDTTLSALMARLIRQELKSFE
jgi:hypothetical protein